MINHPRVLNRTIDPSMIDQDNALAFVKAVGGEVMSATASADLAVVQHARSIAIFVEEAAARRMPLALGVTQLELAADAMKASLAARQAAITARLAFAEIPAQIGITSYGPWCPCDEPNKQQPRPNGALEGAVAHAA